MKITSYSKADLQSLQSNKVFAGASASFIKDFMKKWPDYEFLFSDPKIS